MSLDSTGEPSQRQGRLESWKEIAAYLGRSERTVRRWEEREGLPVHRLHHEKRGSIYAYTYELDAWRESRHPRRSRHRLVAALAIALTAIGALILFGRRAPTGASPCPEAVRAYRLGEFAGNAGRVQVASGIRHYQEAIRLDPRFADAWSALAYAHIAQTFFGDRPAKATLSEARREARRAGELDPSLVAPRAAVAAVSHYLDWDHAAAEKQFLASIRLAPDVAVTHSWLAELFLDLRRFDDAADERHLGYYMPSVDPIYDSVRAHPRFQAVLQRMNLNR